MSLEHKRVEKDVIIPDIRLKECELFELAHVVRVAPAHKSKVNDKDAPAGYPYVKLCCSYEDCDRRLLVLLCHDEASKKETFLLRHYQVYQKAIYKEIPWFQGPIRAVECMAIDPSGSWLLCSCKDKYLYLVPVLALILGPEEVDCPPHWNVEDLTRFPPHNRKGVATCMVWWQQSLINTHICILGTECGEVIFVDLHKFGQPVFHFGLENEAVNALNIVQDNVHGTCYLLITTKSGKTMKFLLESYTFSQPSATDTISITESMLGYEMLSHRSIPLHSCLIPKEKSALRFELLHIQSEKDPKKLSLQFARNQSFLCLLHPKEKIFKVFDVDRENIPMFVYDLTEYTQDILLTDRLLFALCVDDEKASSCIQSFTLPPGEDVLALYRLTTYVILEKTKHNVSGHSHPVDGCLVITSAAVYEIRPRVYPEELFVELAVKNVDTAAADRLAIITGLDVNSLYEQAGDIAMEAGQLQHALELYQASKCQHSRRVRKLSQHASIVDVIVYIQEILHKPAEVSSTDRKKLANLAVRCFVKQILENDSNCEEMSKFKESFCQFINDNFDYDERVALEFLASYGLEEYLFQVAKARGLVAVALDILANKGHFHLAKSTQEFLIAKGFANVVCQIYNGAFIRCLSPVDSIKFLLAKPESILPRLKYVKSLLHVLDESHLLRIAKMFDPSRPVAKTLLMKYSTHRRPRSNSGSSQASIESFLSFTHDHSNTAVPDLLGLFLATLIVLNSKRKFTTFPDLSLIAENCEDKTMSRELEESLLKSGIFHEYTTLSCGQQHSALVTNTGDVYTWGKSSNGRLGHGDLIEEEGKAPPFRVELLHIQRIRVRSVACGREHTLALTRQGVYAWGSSDYGQLGLGSNAKQTRPAFVTELADKDCIALTCGYYHSLALSADRCVWAWGWGVHGQLGFGNVEDYLIPARVTSLDRCIVIRLAAGYSHTAVLNAEGKVYTFGGGVFGQLGHGPIKKQTRPKLVEEIAHENVQLICCGSFETMVVTSSQKFYKWGRNAQLIRQAKDYFQKPDHKIAPRKQLTHYLVPVEVPLKIFSRIIQIQCGNNHAIFLTESGHVYTMGQNDRGQLGLGTRSEKSSPMLVQDLITSEVVSVAAGAAHCVAVTSQGHTYVWGRGDCGQLGLEGPKLKEVVSPVALKNIPVYQMSNEWNASSESLDEPKLNELGFEKYLSDLSSIGSISYGREAIATALYQLYGFYNDKTILRHCYDVKDLFSSSVIYKFQGKWPLYLSYRLKALTNWFRTVETRSVEVLSETKEIAESVINETIRNLSNSSNEDYFPMNEAVLLLNEIFRFWFEIFFDQASLEALLESHLEFLACPLSIVLLRGVAIQKKVNSNDNANETNDDLNMHNTFFPRQFTPGFLCAITEATVEQLKTQAPRRQIFDEDLDSLLVTRTAGTTNVLVPSFKGKTKADVESEVDWGEIFEELLDHLERYSDQTDSISLTTSLTLPIHPTLKTC
ncbi:uncharacterized protein LOC124435332 isoform X2 [Xenia sp. Carnegie-2017]|uniref:uncharacterized protein LOC124435332 isoform X2 n=1 Tax=Xenia sp. Carnegie-2017 TaxID=2897299 RepID=UPI001F036EEB|nr:uncharacterized protein LOC124435332 isoform X2 [Xenia sp. Carnegie-2017]